jgi:hypothetical protein
LEEECNNYLGGNLVMDEKGIGPVAYDETLFLRLAREIAMDISSTERILTNLRLTQTEYDRIVAHPRFQTLLLMELHSWGAATNTTERVKLKSAAIVEEVLPEMYRLLHDEKHPLNSRVELLKTIAKLGHQGIPTNEAGQGNQFRLTINIGNGHNAVRLTAHAPRDGTFDQDPLTIEHGDI